MQSSIVIVLLMTVAFSTAFVCEHCSGESCAIGASVAPMHCPDGVTECYRKTWHGKVYELGCVTKETCNGGADGVVCLTCDTENCNGLSLPHRFGAGGGDAWDSAASLGLVSSVLSLFAAMRLL